MYTNIRSSHSEVLCGKSILKNFAKSTEKRLCKILFLVKLQASGLQLYWKRSFGTGLFLWILLNIYEHFFYIPHPGVVFWICFHLNYLLLFLKLSLRTLSMYLFAGEGIEQPLLFFESLKKLTQQKNLCSKSTTETLNKTWNLLKVNSRDWVSLLTNCNMSKTFSKWFSGVLWACLCNVLSWCLYCQF